MTDLEHPTLTPVQAARPTPPSRTLFQEVARRFFRHKPALISLIVLLILSVMALAAPVIAPYPYDLQDFTIIGQPQPPSSAHLMGTDNLGRDTFSRVLYGARVSLAVGLFSALIAATIGTLIGAVAGFYRGCGPASR